MPKDSVVQKPVAKSAIQTTISYNAKDSIRFDIVNNIVRLYGEAVVDYGTFKLNADFIEIDWKLNTVTATYSTDSTGKKIGVPIFDEGDDQYSANVIKYNYKTKKGYISEIVTEEGGGYIQGNNAFKDENDHLLIENAKYTTCNHADPHYHFKLRKTKVIPGKRVVTDFFNLYIQDIPVPLGLPFGIFPLSEKKTSGIIVPTYGSQTDRGFYLRDGGYYWAVNDYMDMKFLGEIYANGGGGLKWTTRYKSRYKYSGNLFFHYRNVVRNGDEYIRSEERDYQFSWTHNPIVRNGRKFSANVNLASTSYNSNLTTNPDRNIVNTLSSNISYSLPIKGTPFRTTIKARHEQNNETEVVNFTLPSLNVSMTQQYPFRALTKNIVGSKSSFRKFYESISIGYGLNTEYRISNKELTSSFDVYNEDEQNTGQLDLASENFGLLLERGKIGASHTIPIGGTYNVGSFTFSPKFSYNEYWYAEKYNYNYIASDTSIAVDTINGFHRSYQYNTRLTMETRVYGMYNFIGKHKTQVRHTINPSVSLGYTPDFRDEDEFGYYQSLQRNEEGDSITLSKYQNSIYGSSFSGKSASIGFSLNNVLEMKRKIISKDTTEELKKDYKKIKLLDRLSLSSSYNFIADSLKLSRIKINANTQLFNFINIQTNTTLDPYVYDTTGGTQRRIDTYAWEVKDGINKIGSAESFFLSVNTSLNPEVRNKIYKSPIATEEQLEYINNNSEEYIDFSIPWNLNVGYTYRYQKIGFNEASATQSLQLRGNISLTEKWKIDGSVSYDLEQNEFILPRVNIVRDLHCWVMRLNWVPFGPRQSYEFYIGVKAQVLQDLKLTRRRTWIDR
ncbi:MAG: LPS-assembly protein LptD [Cytophagales bacterium]|nr:LPS-assembly protein LptD [Cytophagales bacterium]